MAVQYSFNSNKEFIIENYDRAKTFSSFLPGIAGVDGIPMWSFYVNRGQVMGSFGVKDKNGTIMEFFPANVMYRNIEHQGFRTFIRKEGEIHEIFSSASMDEYSRRLIIDKNLIRIVESNRTLGLEFRVTYFTMPGENYAAIVRKVEIENLNPGKCELEILDGLPQILPAGAGNGEYQAISNLIRSWFDVHNVENNIAYYRTRATIVDSVEVGETHAGNFYLSFSSESMGLIPPIFDMSVLFGENTALTKPDGWDCSADMLHKKRQVPENKVSGGFTGTRTVLAGKTGEKAATACKTDMKTGIKSGMKNIMDNQFVLCTLIGHISSVELINGKTGDFTIDFINEKEAAAGRLVDSLVEDVSTKTSNTLFDQYIEQSFLDNLLRGGYPMIFKAGGKNLVYHVFSRKHGDIEREYNFFSLEPNLYSQGNGSYRDVNQNRRSDVLIRPEISDFVVKHMMSLIQADGYNPLNVKGCTFLFDRAAMPDVFKLIRTDRDGIDRILGAKFTPGRLISYIVEHQTALEVTREAFLEKVLSHSYQEFEAEFGEGYWSDHWTYNMDLIDAYLKIYPDHKERFLFEDGTYRFFYSPVYVLPRTDKYVLANGKVRQYGALQDLDEPHAADGAKQEKDLKATDWLKTKTGSGNIYETNLLAKLISLAVIKFVSLDPCGMGIEMEANKPGWCDAMNGLPGLFGSGLSETVELKRVITFLIEVCSRFDKEVRLFSEEAELLNSVVPLLDRNLSGGLDDFGYWDQASNLKEEYRSKIRFGIEGGEVGFTTKELLPLFLKFDKKLELGLEKALAYGQGIYPTYFTYEALKYERIEGRNNPVNGYPNARVKEFGCRPLPFFLEAPARMLKTMQDRQDAKRLYNKVKASEMYDRKLKMYKTSVPLKDTSIEVGRLMAFTPGWLEREAVFSHMEYKYLLAALESGLEDEFFDDIKTALVPFMKPEIYGRSILENSSFLASSVNPDEAVHGRGFVARLTGTTAEVLSMWFLMMAGKEVFGFEKGELLLRLQPVLPGWLFDEEGKVSFRFLGKVQVTYINPGKLETYGMNGVKPVKYRLLTIDSKDIEINGSVIRSPYAEEIRKGGIVRIEVLLGT